MINPQISRSMTDYIKDCNDFGADSLKNATLHAINAVESGIIKKAVLHDIPLSVFYKCNFFGTYTLGIESFRITTPTLDIHYNKKTCECIIQKYKKKNVIVY